MALEKRVQRSDDGMVQETILSHSSLSDMHQVEESRNGWVVSILPDGTPLIESCPQEIIDFLARVVLSMKERGIIQ
jgi:hypothetical protein